VSSRDHYSVETPAGVLDIWVMRSYPDGTVDILCSCCGARWERRHHRMHGTDVPVSMPAADTVSSEPDPPGRHACA
jgi:hypothetical protein